MERRKNANKQILASADTLHPVRYTLYAVHPCKLITGARLYENLLGKLSVLVALRRVVFVSVYRQAKFADAQSVEIRALAEYQISQVDLAYATGILLGAAKVRWEPIEPAL